MGVTRLGKICAKHPELKGKRYAAGGCLGCQRDNRRARYAKATLKAQEAEPERNVIRNKIEDEVMEMRRAKAIEILREERRRQLRRDEIPAITKRWCVTTHGTANMALIGCPKILCAYKSGGDFTAQHVQRLADQVRLWTSPEIPFICLTDVPKQVAEVGVEAMPTDPSYPGWWQKIHCLRVPGPCLSFDLDVNIIGDLTPLLEAAAEHEFTALADFWVDGPHRLNSSVLGWRDDMSAIYREFATSPTAFMSLYSSKSLWGDQRFIADTYHCEPTIWQELLPGKIVSFKRGALMGDDLSDTRVVVSHGRPRPWHADGADRWLQVKGNRA